MGRPALIILGTILVFGLLAVLVAIAFETPKPPPGASLGERIYYRYCADCHGRDGRGSWRATIFILRPGDLTDVARMRQHSDAYLHELIKNGGAPLGKPGMPGFAFHLSDDQIDAVIAHVRALTARPHDGERHRIPRLGGGSSGCGDKEPARTPVIPTGY